MLQKDRLCQIPLLVGWILSAMFQCLVNGETLPTHKPVSLFPDQPFMAPAPWRAGTLPGGKSFLPVLYYPTFSKEIVGPDGKTMPFSDLPWAKNAIVRVTVDELKDPGIYKDLKNRTNPIMVFGAGQYGEPFMYPGRTQAEIDEYLQFVLKVKRDFGSRFFCWDYGEWSWGGVTENQPSRELAATCDALNMPPPHTHEEANNWFNQRYDLVFKRFQNAGIPVFSWNMTTLNHYEARNGSSVTGNEIAYINAAMDSTFIAFSRGASRQFGIPWGVYAAGFGGAFGHSSFWSSRSPDERHLESDRVRGPYTAVPIQEQKRTLFSVYMAGANFSIKENDNSQGMFSRYYPATIEQTDPRVVALLDARTYAGPYADLWNDLWTTVMTRHDRGTSYAPVALMLDSGHGFVFKYSQTLGLGGIPYTAAEEQIRAVINTIFPWEADQYAPGPFGDIFDVITTDAPDDVINNYRAVVLAGQPRVDARLLNKLRAHVEQGGLLFMACEQLTPDLCKLAGINDTGQTGQDTSFLRASDFYVYQADAPFEYHKVSLDGAEPLFVAGNYDDRSWPVATINRVGKGCIIVGTPVWMGVKGNPAQMHRIFREILGMMADELSPVKVDGSAVKVMYNRTDTGWVITLMNSQGTTIAWPGYKPAIRNADTAAVTLRPRFDFTSASEWITGQEWSHGQADDLLSLILPPGEIRMIELRVK